LAEKAEKSAKEGKEKKRSMQHIRDTVQGEERELQ
jgi:hypothetical protein